jgi:hypothetical protein
LLYDRATSFSSCNDWRMISNFSFSMLPPFKSLASKSLGLIHDITPLRDQLMKYGMNAL